MSGWIKIHRSITNHWLYNEKRVYSKLEAWYDIIMTVNYVDNKTVIKGRLYDVKRGESTLSFESWGKRWNWDKSKVRRFFSLLQKDEMIELKCDNKTTHLTVCNYESYQGERNADETQTNRKRNSDETNIRNKESKKEIYIPELAEFIAYAVQQVPNINREDVRLKYESWKVNEWSVTVNNKTRKIVNWKSTLLNTLPHMKKIEVKPPSRIYD